MNNLNINRYEKYFFYFILLLSLWPVLVSPVFAMLDAPSHLYNAKLLSEIILKKNQLVSSFYLLNNIPVPNCSGHFVLMLLLLFFNALWTQKIFIIIYLLAFPLSFRYLIKVIQGNIAISYFSFPFAYSFFFFLGFFNFLTGLPVLFVSIAFLIKNTEKISLKRYLILAFLSLLLYFSHPIIFAFWTLFITIKYLYLLVMYYLEKKEFKPFFKNIAFLIISLLPAFLLSLNYILNQPEGTVKVKLPAFELSSWLIGMRSLQIFSIINEARYTKILFLLILFLFTTAFVNLIWGIIYEKKKLNILHFTKLFWFDMALVLLILYFILPDETFNAGFISSRINYMFFICLLLGLSQLKQKFFVNVSAVFILLLIFNYQLYYYYVNNKPYNKDAMTLIEAAEYIEENTTLIYINRTEEWVQGHMCNYMGVDKTVIMQHNYEATKNYFPLIWNVDKKPDLYFGSVKADNPCVWLMPNDNAVETEADFILIIGKSPLSAECDSIISHSLDNYYYLCHRSDDDFVMLYRRKI